MTDFAPQFDIKSKTNKNESIMAYKGIASYFIALRNSSEITAGKYAYLSAAFVYFHAYPCMEP